MVLRNIYEVKALIKKSDERTVKVAALSFAEALTFAEREIRVELEPGDLVEILSCALKARHVLFDVPEEVVNG